MIDSPAFSKTRRFDLAEDHTKPRSTVIFMILATHTARALPLSRFGYAG